MWASQHFWKSSSQQVHFWRFAGGHGEQLKHRRAASHGLSDISH
jgi:hypothetical protein